MNERQAELNLAHQLRHKEARKYPGRLPHLLERMVSVAGFVGQAGKTCTLRTATNAAYWCCVVDYEIIIRGSNGDYNKRAGFRGGKVVTFLFERATEAIWIFCYPQDVLRQTVDKRSY